MTYSATTVSDKWQRLPGQVRRFFDIDITSYTASGESLTASDFVPFNSIVQVVPLGLSDNGHVWRWDGSKIRAYKTAAEGGLVTESWPDVTGGSNADQTTSGSAATNGAAIIALATADGTALTTIAAEPNALDAEVTGRNLVISLESQTGGTLNASVGSAAVVGTAPDGTAQSETIDLSAVDGVTLGAGGIVYIVGSKAFATVTSVTPSIDHTADIADARMSVGPGTIFALRGSISAESDIKSVRKDDAAIAAATYVATASPSQIDMGADVADDVDIVIQYDAPASSLVDREASSTDDVGSCRCEVIGLA